MGQEPGGGGGCRAAIRGSESPSFGVVYLAPKTYNSHKFGGPCTVSASLIVRHGAMRFLGTFAPGEGDTYRRGDRAIVRTDRGQEIGEVLCDAEPRAVELLSEPTNGILLRHMTTDDNAT